MLQIMLPSNSFLGVLVVKLPAHAFVSAVDMMRSMGHHDALEPLILHGATLLCLSMCGSIMLSTNRGFVLCSC